MPAYVFEVRCAEAIASGARSLRVGARQYRRLGPCGGFLRAFGCNEHPPQSLKPHECLTFEWAGRRHDRSDVVEEGARAHLAQFSGSHRHGVLQIESQQGVLLAHEPFYIADGWLVECSQPTEIPERNAGTLIGGFFGGEDEQQSPEGGGLRRCLMDLPAQSGTACFTIGFALHRLLPASHGHRVVDVKQRLQWRPAVERLESGFDCTVPSHAERFERRLYRA